MTSPNDLIRRSRAIAVCRAITSNPEALAVGVLINSIPAIEPTPDPRDTVIERLVEAAENLRVKHEYIMRGRTYSMTHMQIVGETDAALAAAKEVMK